jgi:hypothetical protein
VILLLLSLAGWRSHHCQPLHPARAALRVCARRQAVPALRVAVAGRHGADLRRHRDTGRGGRRLGGACQSNRPHRGHGSAHAVRLTLLFGSLADRLTRPLVALGNRLTESAGDSAGESIGASLLLGVATGLLWSPCAGPILGLILTGAALRGASANTTLLLLAYAAGAATSLAAALLLGGRVFAAMKNSLGAGEWIRRGLGVAVLLGVVAIALGLDTGILTFRSRAPQGSSRCSLDTTRPARQTKSVRVAGSDLPVEGVMPPLDGAVAWLNSPPLTHKSAARQGRAGRFLDLFLHQLPARAALCPRLGAKIQRSRPGGDRRACAGIRLRKGYRQCEAAPCTIWA